MEHPPPPINQKQQRHWVWKTVPLVAVIIVCTIIILPLYLLTEAKKEALAQKQASETAAARPLTNVVTLEMIPGRLEEKLNLPGIAKPWISLNVVSEVAGKIVKKQAQEGTYVRKGDVLAVIDKSDYQNAYASALASWEMAVANEKRLSALVKKNFVTKSQLDDAVAMVKTTKAALDNARLNLKRCTILSPMDGLVDRVHIETGTYLAPGDPVAQILQMDKLKITVGIPESDVDAVRKLKTFEITVDALGGRIFEGQHHYLYKTTDTMARLYNLEIKVDNPDMQILPDMFARVRIVKQKEEQGLGVPMYSLVSRADGVGVFVENDGVVRYRPVKTGFQDGWKIQIAEGLSPGENVVVVGHKIIEDGESIRVTRTLKDVEELIQ